MTDLTRTARKNHTCFLCGGDILTGVKYLARYWIDTSIGRIGICMHLACEAITKDWDEDSWTHHDPVEFSDLINSGGEQ